MTSFSFPVPSGVNSSQRGGGIAGRVNAGFGFDSSSLSPTTSNDCFAFNVGEGLLYETGGKGNSAVGAGLLAGLLGPSETSPSDTSPMDRERIGGVIAGRGPWGGDDGGGSGGRREMAAANADGVSILMAGGISSVFGTGGGGLLIPGLSVCGDPAKVLAHIHS